LFSDSLPRKSAAKQSIKANLRLLATVAAAAAALGASPCGAQVMEIAPDGTLSVRQGSGAATFEVVTPASDKVIEQDVAVDVPPMAITPVDSTTVPPQFVAAVNYAASSANISPNLLASLVWQESRWNPRAVSPKGAMGLAQLMPGTARYLGVNPADPVANLVGGARYLRQLLDQFDGNVERALAAYNAGPGRVRSAGGIPAIAETQAYVASIVRRVSSITGGTE
jgi:soluble lytic murein transglycosylase-like protein